MLFLKTLTLLLVLVAVETTAAVEPVTIPLDQIWAYGMPSTSMPGTRDVRELEPDHFGSSVRKLAQNEQMQLLLTSLNFGIHQTINLRGKKPIGPGFVVEGKGKDTLGEILKILKEDGPSQHPISTNSEATLFFYGTATGHHLHLKNVRRSGNEIVIRFQFVPEFMTSVMTEHFALIPLGVLPAGKYSVVMEGVPSENKKYPPAVKKYLPVIDVQAVRKIYVCRDFEFQVIDGPARQ